ncbi:MAG: DNA repair protein RecO [Planctomycetota bacterium]|nr:DNA repair protein RecO [Planctomycetota bacterium]
MPQIDTEGISLRAIRYSETSQIVTLLTREAGMVRVMGKGTFKKRQGPLDLLQVYRILLITKPSGALATLCEWECIDPLPGVRKTFEHLLAAWYKAEIAGFLAPEGEAFRVVYETVRDSLEDLDRGADPATNTLLFAGRMLGLSGYQPALDGCGTCGKPVPLRGTIHYEGGHLICRSCPKENSQRYGGSALALVRSLLSSAAADSTSVRYPPHLVIRAQEFLDDQFREITERDLRTVRYWKQWGSARGKAERVKAL